MAQNVGSADKIIRIVVGALLIILASMGTIGWWGWVGVVPIATALMGWCPAYTLLGVKTCSPSNLSDPSGQ
ncbi:MAG: DUF2892 domain-containing protein [Gammaproteobacteria bacterium]|nr:DUF2892 domain-containing protein [Gammaproteobacteria bacterium]MCP5196368.1 DUF2892 domain-containing protein [Gammaproteobacteria bacterium]